jgi:hypothetical protein
VGELAGIGLTGERARRRAEADGAAAAAVIAAQAGAAAACKVVPLPPAGPAPDMLYICFDGTGVPMTPAGTAGRAGKKAADLDTALGYFDHNAPRVRYRWFRSGACSPAPASWKPGARRSSPSAANCLACDGRSPAPTASSPCAAWTPATGGKRPGPTPARPAPPNQHLNTRHTQTTQARQSYRPVTYILAPHLALDLAIGLSVLRFRVMRDAEEHSGGVC